jgi:hypothetical protein
MRRAVHAQQLYRPASTAVQSRGLLTRAAWHLDFRPALRDLEARRMDRQATLLDAGWPK